MIGERLLDLRKDMGLTQEILGKKSKEHEKLEYILKAEIVRLIRDGVSEFFVGGQTGIDTLAALLILNVKEEFGTTANLNLVLPYKNMYAKFNRLQKDNYEWIERNANAIEYLNERYSHNCYRERNQYMVEKGDYLIAVYNGYDKRSGTYQTINMAKKKGREITIINSQTLDVQRIQPIIRVLK